jgi:hypothetical protein
MEHDLDAAMAQINTMKTGMRKRHAELCEEKALLETQKVELVSRNGSGKVKDKLKLNVGGASITTRRSTLMLFPESKLAALVAGHWEGLLLRDRNNRIFIDANPDCFRKLVEFLNDRKLAGPNEPFEVPAVPNELVPTMDRMLVHFGFDHLFEQQQDKDANKAVVAGEPKTVENATEPAAKRQKEKETSIVIEDGKTLNLPPRTVDHIITATYGVLGQPAKEADVTALLSDSVGQDGELDIGVISLDSIGIDPAPLETKSLSVKYRPCGNWEVAPFEQLTRHLIAAANAERAELRKAIAQHQRAVRAFAEEKAWIQQYLAAPPDSEKPGAPEVVELDVSGDRVCVKRSTLRLCPESPLAKQFDAETWTQDPANSANRDDLHDSEDSDEDGATLIEVNSYCFRKIVDQLRLIATAAPGDPPPPPIIAAHEQASFGKVLDYYFCGNEGFIRQSIPILIKAWGGGGGGGQHRNNNHGGAGGYAEACYLAQQGDEFTITVGGRGEGGQSSPNAKGGSPNGGFGNENYCSGGGGGSSHVRLAASGIVLVGAGGGGGGTGGQSSAAGGGGGGGTHNGVVGSGGQGAHTAADLKYTNGTGEGVNGGGGGGCGEGGTDQGSSDFGGRGGRNGQSGNSANGAGGQSGTDRAGGGGGGAASFQGILANSSRTINATTCNPVNTEDPHYIEGGSGAGGQHGANFGIKGRVVLKVGSTVHTFDLVGDRVFKL